MEDKQPSNPQDQNTAAKDNEENIKSHEALEKAEKIKNEFQNSAGYLPMPQHVEESHLKKLEGFKDLNPGRRYLLMETMVIEISIEVSIRAYEISLMNLQKYMQENALYWTNLFDRTISVGIIDKNTIVENMKRAQGIGIEYLFFPNQNVSGGGTTPTYLLLWVCFHPTYTLMNQIMDEIEYVKSMWNISSNDSILVICEFSEHTIVCYPSRISNILELVENAIREFDTEPFIITAEEATDQNRSIEMSVDRQMEKLNTPIKIKISEISLDQVLTHSDDIKFMKGLTNMQSQIMNRWSALIEENPEMDDSEENLYHSRRDEINTFMDELDEYMGAEIDDDDPEEESEE